MILDLEREMEENSNRRPNDELDWTNEEKKMRREDKKKLTINRRIIVNHLIDLEGVLDYLISKQIFTPAIRERIVYVWLI